MKIAILIDKPRFDYLPNEEGKWEDEQKLRTANGVVEILSQYFECVILQSDEHLLNKLKAEKVDFVFNLCNGIRGKDRLAQIPAFLEFADIPYTGSSILGHALCLNKVYTAKILKGLAIPTPDFVYVYAVEELDKYSFEFPVIVKPSDEGSSRGIHQNSLVGDMDTLRLRVSEGLKLYNPPIMINQYIDGREFHVGVLGNGLDLSVMPIEEINLDRLPADMHKFYSFEVKTHYKDFTTYICPAPMDDKIQLKIINTAKKAFNALALRDYARLDIRLQNGVPYILEVNSLPGVLSGHSALTRMAFAQGMDYEGLILQILINAFKRCGINPRKYLDEDTLIIDEDTAS